jgi:hypothetical protein
MLVVSNTSPISNLAIIGRLNLLRLQFGEIRIPMAVKQELARLSHYDALKAIQQAMAEGWIKQAMLRDANLARTLRARLDPGEAEAIALAMELGADLILLDERDARAAANYAGLRVTGVPGVLLGAKRDGLIPAVKPEVEALRPRARFFVSRHLEAQIIQIAGE